MPFKICTLTNQFAYFRCCYFFFFLFFIFPVFVFFSLALSFWSSFINAHTQARLHILCALVRFLMNSFFLFFSSSSNFVHPIARTHTQLTFYSQCLLNSLGLFAVAFYTKYHILYAQTFFLLLSAFARNNKITRL